MDRTYQLNIGGNTDFLNMLTAAAQVQEDFQDRGRAVNLDELWKTRIFISGLQIMCRGKRITRVCFLRMEGRIFGDVPINLELRLSVSSPNSGGCVIDAVRVCKVAMDRKIAGPQLAISAYTMKHPPVQFPDEVAKEMVERFIRGETGEHDGIEPCQPQVVTVR
jgi:myo-inositol-1-phosphate synthase